MMTKDPRPPNMDDWLLVGLGPILRGVLESLYEPIYAQVT